MLFRSDAALAWRRGADSALEIGCSIGVFSKALAGHFGRVTGTDIAGEALRLAARDTRELTNLRFVRGTLETLALGERHDVIFCAEILYYIAKEQAETVCRKLDEHLSPRGIVITVSHVPDGREETYTVQDWDSVLGVHFQRLSLEDVPDAYRPYRIVVYACKP